MQNNNKDDESASPIRDSEDKSLKRYKNILLVRVLGSFVLIFIIIIQRVFSSYTRSFENTFIDSFQEALGIGSYDDIPSIFYYFHQFRNIEIFLAHLYFTLFFLTNALITFKCMLVHFNTIVIVANVEVMLSEPRPFWDNSGIVGAVCDPSYAFPSYSVFTIAFFFWYSSHCWDTDDEERTTPCVRKLKVFFFVIFIVFYSLSSLVMGLNYPSQIILAILYSLMCFYIVNFFDKMLNNLIMRSSIQVDSAKRYTIYWLIYLILLAVSSLLVYSSSDAYVNIVWLKNFFECLKNQTGSEFDQKEYYHMLGPWASFVRTTIIFAMAGAIFGMAKTFRDLNGMSWFQTKRSNKLIMASVANLLLLPVWLLSVFESKLLPLLAVAGINEYLYNATLYGALYYIAFGVLPTKFFKRFRLLNRDSGYFVANELDLRTSSFAPMIHELK